MAAKRKRPVATEQELTLVCVLFALVGGVMMFPMLLAPLGRTLGAFTWRRTPCVVLQSGVVWRQWASGDKTGGFTVSYNYEFEGRRHVSHRFDRADGVSGPSEFALGRVSRSTWAKRHPAGSETVCYVNPKEPHEATLFRVLPLGYVAGLVPLLAFTIGALPLAFKIHCAIVERREKRLPPSGHSPSA